MQTQANRMNRHVWDGGMLGDNDAIIGSLVRQVVENAKTRNVIDENRHVSLTGLSVETVQVIQDALRLADLEEKRDHFDADVEYSHFTDRYTEALKDLSQSLTDSGEYYLARVR